MSAHSYSRGWLHLIWGTLNREKLLHSEAAARVCCYISEYAESNGIYMKINYVNADHVHALVDLPTSHSVEKLIQLIKGSSSHWINANNVIPGKFAWGRGYGVFSVSESNVGQVAAYIAAQRKHHQARTFAEEFKEFVDRHGLHWKDEADESR
jgi:REP element-mobilizing transposase RayT